MISLAMIVRNEAARLPACLQSVEGAVDEVVVVDTGSRDDTPELARRQGARVYDWPWRDNFAAARNESLRHALGDWVLVLDADERLLRSSIGIVRAVAALRDVAGADCRVVSALPPGQPSAVIAAWYCRLFRRGPGIRFEGRVHEQIAPAIRAAGGVIVRSDVAIAHLGYAEPNADKLGRNLALLRRQLAEHPGDAFTLFNLGLTLASGGDRSEAAAALECALRAPERPLPRDLRGVAWMKLAEGHLARGDWEAAGRAAERALAEEPDLGLARYILGRALFEQGDIDGAGRHFRRLAGATSDALGMALHPRLVALANALVELRQRRFAEAAHTLESVAVDDPTGEIAFQLGNAYLGLGRLDAAASAYTRAQGAGFASPHLERRLLLARRLTAAPALASAR
jgi:tetratricopeptide (TPR) repeat protein